MYLCTIHPVNVEAARYSLPYRRFESVITAERAMIWTALYILSPSPVMCDSIMYIYPMNGYLCVICISIFLNEQAPLYSNIEVWLFELYICTWVYLLSISIDLLYFVNLFIEFIWYLTQSLHQFLKDLTYKHIDWKLNRINEKVEKRKLSIDFRGRS